MNQSKKILTIKHNLIKNLSEQPHQDLSDIGNTIGLTVGKQLSEEMGFDRQSFLHGIEHGFSLIDGTHPKPKDKC